MEKNRGFTLVELVITMGVLAVLLGATVLIINPVAQFSNARNSERRNHINTIINAIKQNAADHRGIFTCSDGPIPTSTTVLGTNGYDINGCIAPDYIAVLPMDPLTGTSNDIGYSIVNDVITGRITITGDDAELGKTITVTR